MKAGLYSRFMATGAMKVVNIVSLFAVAVALARLLGAEGYGVYSYVYVIVSLLGVVANFGTPRLAMRETARMLVEQNWCEMRNITRWTTRLVLVVSCVTIVVALVGAWILGVGTEDAYLQTLLIGLFLVPFLGLAALRGGVLRGLGHVILGQLPEFNLRPLVFTALIAVAFGVGCEFTPPSAMALFAASSVIAFSVGHWILRAKTPEGVKSAGIERTSRPAWFKAALAIAMVSVTTQINSYADVLILGIFNPAEDIGAYRVGYQVAMLAGLGLQAATIAAAPMFAASLKAGDMTRSQRIASSAGIFSIAIAAPAFVIFFLWGDVLLELVFGPEFVVAYMATLILLAGHLLRSFFGPVSEFLIMGGQEGAVARIMLLSTLANVILNLVLIPAIGREGAALSTFLTIFGWNTALFWMARRRLGVKCLAWAAQKGNF